MNIIWIARIVLATILILASALAVEMVLGWFGRPRRWIWLGAMVAVIALPLVVSLAPGVMPALGLEQQGTIPLVVASAGMPLNTTPFTGPVADAGNVVIAPIVAVSRMASIWIASSAFLLALALIVAARLAVLRSRARPAIADGVAVRLTTNLGPLVTGYLKPAILLPAWVMDADATERRLILAHEREHIAGGDHWLVPLGALLVIAMPWNLALWMLYARLRLAIETDCDARVIAAGADRREYGAALIRVAGSAGPHSVLSPAWTNRARQLEQRVRAMTETSPRGRGLRAVLLSIGSVFLVAVACDAATPDPVVSQLPVRSTPPVRMHLIASPPSTRAQATPVPQALPPGFVRVTGYTREEMRTRVRVTRGGRIEVQPGTRVIAVSGDTIIEVYTPALLRIIGEQYRAVAEAIDPGTEVEIAGTAPAGSGYPRAGSARGTAPMVKFDRAQAGADVVPSTPIEIPSHTPQMGTSSPADPGQIRLESESEKPIRVLVIFSGAVTSINGMAVTGAGEAETTTPVIVEFKPGERFAAAFVAVDSTRGLRADAAWTRDSGLSGHYPNALAICAQGGGGFGIGGYVRGKPLTEACK